MQAPRNGDETGATEPPTMTATSLAACYALHCQAVNTLAIDVGGSGLKAAVLDAGGQMLGDSVRIDTPVGSHPDQIVAVIKRRGVEMVITLGTGFGTGLYEDGRLCPHLEISQAPFRKGETYDQQLGNAARKAVGGKKWQRRVCKAIDNLRTLTCFDHLYVGGGNSSRLDCELPADVTIVDNKAGLYGGAFLWLDTKGPAG